MCGGSANKEMDNSSSLLLLRPLMFWWKGQNLF
jgi:hypothetical protein